MIWRRLLSLQILTVLVLLLSPFFTTFSFAEGNNESEVTDVVVQQGSDILTNERKKLANEWKEKHGYGGMDGESDAYTPDEKVRIIVEVDQPEKMATLNQKEKKQEMKQAQDKVIQQIEKGRSESELRHRFFEGVHGFSMEIAYEEVKEIRNLSHVKEVHIAKTYQLTLNESKGLVQAQETWEEYGLKGEGMVVAVVDSGLDHTHPDMVLSKDGKKEERWTESSIQAVLDETDVDDIWYSDKVPSGYDWADMDNDVVPASDSHGTHVAGIVGANGDESNGGVVGIAPEVQLLAEKVFSDTDGNAYEDDIIAGIEHAVELDADAINLSLGTDSGFVGEAEDPIQKTIRQATENGVLVVAASGNAFYSTKNDVLETAQKPYASNPDIGIVGSPGVSPYALSVASYENDMIRYGTLTLADGSDFPYADQTYLNFKLHQTLDANTSYDLVYGGEGREEDLEDLDVDGKIVLVQPETAYSTYSYAQFAAERKGARAVVIVPPEAVDDFPTLQLSEASIPAATTSKEAGEQVIDGLEEGEHVSFQLGEGVWLQNPEKEEMSDFSSMGAPHTLGFKPEIAAPGGAIYSTALEDDYEVMSGTSMASPHVTGGSSLVLQSLYDKGLDKTEDAALQTKVALMNTSEIVHQPDTGIPYSPRKQGAGLMQIKDAIDTPVLVTDKDASLEEGGAVALEEISGNTAQFSLDMESLSDEKLEYDVYVDVLTDETETMEFDTDEDGEVDTSHEYLSLETKRVEGAKVLVNGSPASHEQGAKVLVTPDNNVKLYVNIFLPEDMEENRFVEGYVRLVPKDPENSPELTVPYMGFYGDWDTPSNIDPSPWEEDKFLGYTVLWDDVAELPLGFDMETGEFDTDKIAISSRSVAPGVYSTFTALRNLEKTEMYIENESGEVIEKLGDFSENTGEPFKFPKNLLPFEDNYYSGYTWEVADDDGTFVSDGDYQYTIKSTLAFEGAEAQYQRMPIKVDSVSPTVQDIQVEPVDGNYEIRFKATDNENGSGYYGAVLYIDGQYVPLEPGKQSYVVDEKPESVIVVAADYAYNEGIEVWGDPSYADEELLVSWFTAYDSGGVNEENPLEVVGYGLSRLQWTVVIEDTEGNEVDRFIEERQHTIRSPWTPEEDIESGDYIVYALVKDADGFEVKTNDVPFVIQ